MDYGHGCNDKGEEEVEREESGEGGIVYGEASSDSLDEGASYVGDGREKVGNNGGPSEGYLSSGQYVANECSYYYE